MMKNHFYPSLLEFLRTKLQNWSITVDFSLIENQEEKIIKISFRSQGDFDVNQFARDHFNGGGHINAAGGKSELSMEETIQKFENLVIKL